MSKNRRSTLAALTAEQQAFLRPQPAPFRAPHQTSCLHDRPRPDRATEGRGAGIAGPAAARKCRAQPLRSTTLRLTPELATLLRRASVERSLEYEEPFTQQGITEAALRDWLAAHGYPIE